MRFLVVDDSSTMRRIIINALRKLGDAECHEASNGREGIERLAARPVDLVITDWNMPEMNGLDFVRAVRANDATRHLPVLMVTTNAGSDNCTDAMNAGITSYVVKPFTPDTIREKVQASLKAG
jgi:two-component system chemotaxis response regulator CheY